MKTLIHFVAATFVFASCALAQTPKELTEKYFEAAEANNYVKVANMIVPDELAEFRKGLNFLDELPADKAKEFRQMFFGPEASAESVKKLTDAEFLGVFMEMTIRMKAQGLPVKFMNHKIHGEKVGDDLASVTVSYEIKIGDEVHKEKEDLEFKKLDDKWLLLLPESLKSFPAGFKASLGL